MSASERDFFVDGDPPLADFLEVLDICFVDEGGGVALEGLREEDDVEGGSPLLDFFLGSG